MSLIPTGHPITAEHYDIWQQTTTLKRTYNVAPEEACASDPHVYASTPWEGI